ncbi:2'-5' RNA ligase family protein [Terriglobus sp.]|uniref:2'-5' RNA ligase family protein n=1 Tax=Terriglobus sp. TaxID=1889013 RepID=UPI003AFFA024
MSCVLALALDDAAQQRFDALRQQWFPPARNQIPAHLTLFHTLPETEHVEAVLQAVAQTAATFAMQVGSVRSLGRGVAFFLDSHAAMAVERQLRGAFLEQLTPQDRQGFRPHVVVQNKVEPAVAKETLAMLQAGFTPWECRAVGLDLWRYLGGPWKLLRRFDFAG